MRKIYEILRFKYGHGLGNREVGLNVSVSRSTENLGHKSLGRPTTEIYLHSIGDSQVTAMKGLEGRFSTVESKTATKGRHQNEK